MKSIFIAESEKHVREALRLVLDTRTDFKIIAEAGDAESLLAQVCQQAPDMILLDWSLPGIHPYRLIRTLQKYCPAMKVVVTSVKPEHENVAKEYGVDGFLSKQLPPESFMTALEAFLL
jgi:DNA-binding NarL/FixJ family response regulator